VKRLFLTSFDLSKFPEFVGADPKDVSIGFISTAADVYDDKWFVEKDRKFFLDRGYKLIDVDINDAFQLKYLNNVDVVYVSGGNCFYLLERSVKSGALGMIRELIESGKMYAGASAGAVFAGPSIEPMALLDDPKAAPGLKNFEALGVVDFVILPHYGKEKYLERYKRIMEDFKDSRFKLVPLADNQYILAEGGEFRKLEI